VRAAAVQPITFVTLTRVTNNASCNWVSLVQVNSVQLSSSGVNTALLFAKLERMNAKSLFIFLIVEFMSATLALWSPGVRYKAETKVA